MCPYFNAQDRICAVRSVMCPFSYVCSFDGIVKLTVSPKPDHRDCAVADQFKKDNWYRVETIKDGKVYYATYENSVQNIPQGIVDESKGIPNCIKIGSGNKIVDVM